MSEPDEEPNPKLPQSADELMRRVASRENRMLRARRSGPPAPWRSVSIVGVVGWSVVLPTLAGVALGTWIDQQWPSRFSWTLMLLAAGVALGCIIAWTRIKREQEDH